MKNYFPGKKYIANFKNAGITLLLSVVMTTIALSIGLGVSSILFREKQIVRGLLPSFIAFAAADAGTECALYWRHFDDEFKIADAPASINCNSLPLSAALINSNTFKFSLDLSNGSCATVFVKRQTVGSVDCTRIESRGTNESCTSPGSANIVERALVIQSPDTCTLTP